MEHKILVVDDDEDLRSEIRDFLEGHTIIEAASGEEALRLLRKAHNIGLVILDVMMPGINGLDVLAAVKKSDPDVKIAILTGHSSKDVAIEALKGHADDYIEKPVIGDRLKNSVKRLMAMSNGQPDLSHLDIQGKIEEVKHFVERNCFKKTTLEDAAAEVCLSPKYLSRIFKKYARMDFSDYRLRIKMHKAKELLTRSGYNVNQVSERLGYENAESFIRQFKKLVHQTPTQYRLSIQRKKLQSRKMHGKPAKLRKKSRGRG